MKNLARFILVAILGLIAAALFIKCGCGDGSVCGSGNTVVGPSGTPTPSPSPLPSAFATPPPAAIPACVPQTQPFVCAHGNPTLGPILEGIQSTVPWAPEAIYVQNLVAAINKDPRVCAVAGFPLPSDEISIKARVSNATSENWDVVNADGSIQAIPAGTSTPAGPANICTPARF